MSKLSRLSHERPEGRPFLGAAALLTILASAFQIVGVPAAAADVQSVTVSGELRVYDGDTLEIGHLVIRLHGIDAPELKQSCVRQDDGTWPCGEVAANRLVEQVAAATLSCDALDRDPYGRVVARCAADDVDIGTTMVAEGLAWAFVEFSRDYSDVEAAARAAGTGFWQAETQTAQEYRADAWARAVAAAPGECPIKGNVNGDERIYHTPWSPYYGRVRMNVDKGERWFCNEAEAQAAGWRPARSR